MTDSAISQTSNIGEFFTVEEDFSVNLVAVDEAVELPSEEAFLADIPELFQMASNMAGSEQDWLQQLKMDNQQSPVLVRFLEQMNQRMVMMLGYLMRYEDDPDCRFSGIEYGGGGFRVRTQHPIEQQQRFQAKVFLKAESLAIFCYVRCVAVEDDKVTLEFERITEQDREHFIRASLHSQSRQLKNRAQQRQQQQQ